MEYHQKQPDDSAPVVKKNAKPTSHGDLPALPPNADSDAFCSILLFYQYAEPLWKTSQHRQMLRKLIEICEQHKITGRGRVAPEGLNCTLSGNAKGLRNVCEELRAYDPLFWETDFKITDFVPKAKQFKSLSVRKTEELVAYGLKGQAVAPSLTQFAGTHLEADAYHEALQDPDAVVIDVRNFYETKLGAFNPPQGGAQLIDPQLRNSVEFPRWLADPKTQEKLNNKKVLMYCTGGIRCERATALLNQMVAASEDTSTPSADDTPKNDDKSELNNKYTTKNDSKPTNGSNQKATESSGITCKPKGVFELRGGIERYVKTFPQGGFWKGKNYLFDRRMEQIPEGRSMNDVEDEIDAKCCVCLKKWTVYRGQYSCASKMCGVPVIVCNHCMPHADKHAKSLQCDLCRENYRHVASQPDLAEIKRKAESRLNASLPNNDDEGTTRKKQKLDINNLREGEYYPDRLFLSRLPLTATATKLQQALLPPEVPLTHAQRNLFRVHWLTDPLTKAFYGSCIVQMPNAKVASNTVAKAKSLPDKRTKHGIRVDKKRIKVTYVRKVDKGESTEGKGGATSVGDILSLPEFTAREYPPIQ